MEIVAKRFEGLTPDELYEILRCRVEVFVVEQNIPYQDLDGIDCNSTHVFIKNNNRIIAYLRVIDAGIKYDEVSIGRVLVDKEHRGKGLGRMIMLKGIEIANNSSDGIIINAQTYLRLFYESLGFKPVSEIFTLEGRPHVTMVFRSRPIKNQ